MEINSRWDPNRCSSNSSSHPLSRRRPSQHAPTAEMEVARATFSPADLPAAVCSLRPRRVSCSRLALWFSSDPGLSNLQQLPDGRRPPLPPRWPLHPPVVALFAQLLLEVAQGETVAAHAPPVRDLLAAEEIRHHGLGAARPVAAEALLALLPAEGSQRGRGGRVRALAVPTRRRSEDTTEMVDLS